MYLVHYSANTAQWHLAPITICMECLKMSGLQLRSEGVGRCEPGGSEHKFWRIGFGRQRSSCIFQTGSFKIASIFFGIEVLSLPRYEVLSLPKNAVVEQDLAKFLAKVMALKVSFSTVDFLDVLMNLVDGRGVDNLEATKCMSRANSFEFYLRWAR